MDRNVKSVESETIVINQSGFIKCTSSNFISIYILHDKNVSSIENQHQKGLVPSHHSVLDYLQIQVCLHSIHVIKVDIFFSIRDQARVRSVQCIMGQILFGINKGHAILIQFRIFRKEKHSFL